MPELDGSVARVGVWEDRLVRARLGIAVALAVLGACGLPIQEAWAQGVPATPINEGPDAATLPKFIGEPASPRPVTATEPPRHPFMAPNGRNNLHVDAYMTDVHRQSGPLGRDMERLSTLLEGVCASVTFDTAGRIVVICVGLEGPKLVMLDPKTLALLASMPLPARRPGTASIFNDFAGGGYFYLDQRDRAVIPTTDRHIYVVAQAGVPAQPRFALERDYDIGVGLSLTDKIVSALPDWSGRIWFVTTEGVVGTLDPISGQTRLHPLEEPISNSFAADEDGAIYVVSNRALYRFAAGADGAPAVVWREEYPNSGIAKPGQVHAGSGTTPTLMGADLVAITDNADPMNVLVYRRAAAVKGNRLICSRPVFAKGASATDNSLIATDTAMVVENNYGYTGPAVTQNGGTTSPGIERVDLDRDGRGCRTVWRSDERAPSVVPKLSLAAGLVYVYTKEQRADDADAWYLTAIDFRTGRTVYKRLAGEGLGHNNNYAPITIGPDGSLYVGALGGLILLRDATPPPGDSAATRPRLRLSVRPRSVRPGDRTRFRFRVTAAGRPVVGATVRFAGATAHTDARGRAGISRRLRRPGRRRARASRSGHRAAGAWVRVRRPRRA